MTVTETQLAELKEFIQSANENLFKAGAEGAEQSFGLGCLLGTIPPALLIVVLYMSGVFNLILALIVIVLAALAVTGIATLVSSFARGRSIRETYRKKVGPEIDTFLSRHSLTRLQFDDVAGEILTDSAPLRMYLTHNQHN